MCRKPQKILQRIVYLVCVFLFWKDGVVNMNEKKNGNMAEKTSDEEKIESLCKTATEAIENSYFDENGHSQVNDIVLAVAKFCYGLGKGTGYYDGRHDQDRGIDRRILAERND